MGTNFSIYNIFVTHSGHCCSLLYIIAVLLTGKVLSFVVEPQICNVLDNDSKLDLKSSGSSPFLTYLIMCPLCYNDPITHKGLGLWTPGVD